MRSGIGFWVIAIVLVLSFQSQAVLDEVISIGGGNEDPKIRLSAGETYPISVRGGDVLQSRCYLEDSTEEDEYTFSWVRRDRNDRETVIGQGKDLYLPNVNPETFRDPIYCLLERETDGETFDKQLLVQFYGRTETKTLKINPMPSEDMRTGRIVRKCEVLPAPPSEEQWVYTWADPNGRIISNNDILSTIVTGEVPSVTYTCEAKNLRTGDVLLGEFTVNARNVPVSPDTFNTEIEAVTRSLEFNRPYEARCRVNPTPSERVDYVWYYRGRMISQGERLLIGRFDRFSAGEYVCAARSRGEYGVPGREYANATLGLRLKASKDDHIEMAMPPGATLITNQGERRELHCEIPQGDQSGVRWYQNGTLIDAYSPANRTGKLQRVDYLRVSIITINGVEDFHEGNWECRTETGTKMVDVIVVIPEYDVEVNPPEYELNEGESMEVHCSAQGTQKIPNTLLEWFFRPVGSSEMRPLQIGQGAFERTDDQRAQFTSVITKFHVTKMDEGEYICREPRGQIGISTLVIRQPERHTLHITPGIIKVRPGQDVSVLCYSMNMDRRTRGPRPRLRIFDNRLSFYASDADDNSIRGTVSRINTSFNGTIIECYSEGGMSGVDTVRAIIQVEDICSAGYRRCRNGECLEAGRFCNGIRDCADGSDEDPRLCELCDPIVRRCEVFRGQQPSKPTFMVHWQCDGEDDCGNGFDETNCQIPEINFCVKQQYTCPRTGYSIPRAFVCDSDPDCSNREDEEGCREPQILDQPRDIYNHRRGETVTITCQVAGFPNPRVIWRFNWGCLNEDGNRMTIRNRVENCGTPAEKTISTLTISDFRPGDDGIYNCEGLNGLKRAMSRDYFVALTE